MKRHIFLLTLLTIGATAANAQYYLGVANSNYDCFNSLYLNPANIADSRFKFVIDVASLNGGVDNNLGSVSSNGGVISAINKGNTKDIFANDNRSTFSLLAPYADAHLPGFMYSISEKHSLALSARIRGISQFSNFDQSLYQTVIDPSFVINNDVHLTSKNFNYTANLWSEVGLTYAGVVLERGHSELKVGVTARYLGGIGYLALKGNNLDVNYKHGNDTVFVNQSDLEYSSNILSTKSALLNGFSNNNVLSEFFGAKDGAGMGGDIGVVYDYTGTEKIYDRAKNKYKFRISAAVTDLGYITYNSNSSSARLTGNGNITGDGLRQNADNFEDFRHYALAQGFTADTSHQATKVYMPTTLRLSADYNINNVYFVNVAYINNLANRNNFGNSFYNQVTITPRYDIQAVSVGVPLTYSMLSNTFKAGVGVRVGGFFVGSDDLLALVAGNQTGFNLYAGGSVPFHHSKEKDRDGDGIPDKYDKCPDEPGTAENEGCPVEPDSEHGGSDDNATEK